MALVRSAIVGMAKIGSQDGGPRRRVSPVPHGITFAPAEMSGVEILRNGMHTFVDWQLVPTAAPTVEIPGAIYVPELRLTEPAGGRATFGMRSGTWTFRPKRGGTWARRISDIANYLNGRLVKAVLDDEKAFYYVGLVSAKTWEIGDMNCTVTFEYKFYPYKYELTDSLDPWLWDPFNFYNGIIRKYADLTVNTSLSLVIHGREMPVIPDFYAETNHTGLTVTYNGVTHQLYVVKNNVIYDGVNAGLSGYTIEAGSSYDPATGRFTVSGIELGAGDSTLTFTGTGKVSVAYRGGRL